MRKEIKRNNWSRFCRSFSANNLLRPARVEIERDGQRIVPTAECFPFLGLALSKRGRFIDGLQVVAGQPQGEAVALPIVEIMDPAEVILEQTKNGRDQRLRLTSKDGTVAVVELAETEPVNAYQELLSKVAYSLYESRGYGHGNDRNDWFDADRRLRETIEQFS
ncbi:MAG: DUF2934 domain-containing protein [bacterium]